MTPEKAWSEFLDKVVEVAERRSETLEWLGPLWKEQARQAESQKWNLDRIIAAIKQCNRTPGYHQDYKPVLLWLVDNWKDPVPSHSSASGSASGSTLSPKRRSSSPTGRAGGGIASRYLASIQKVEESKEREVRRLKQAEREERVVLGKSSEKLRFKKAVDLLRLRPVRNWFRHLRDVGNVNFVPSCVKESKAFMANATRATEVVDGLLTSRRLYDDSRAVTEDAEGASGSEAKESMIRVVLEHYGLTDINSPTHWFAKGLILSLNVEIPIRCDGSAALAFYSLCVDKAYTGGLALVRQGDPRTSGHWFVVGGVTEDLVTENINLAGSRDKNSWSFTIDLWGGFFVGASTTVFRPATCLLGDWAPEVLWRI